MDLETSATLLLVALGAILVMALAFVVMSDV